MLRFTIQVYEVNRKTNTHLIDLSLNQGHPLVFFPVVRKFYEELESSCIKWLIFISIIPTKMWWENNYKTWLKIENKTVWKETNESCLRTGKRLLCLQIIIIVAKRA